MSFEIKSENSRQADIVRNERALIGLIILVPSTMDCCEIELGGYDWLDPVCSVLWPLFVEMRIAGEPVGDFTLLYGRVGAKLDQYGGRAAIGRLVQSDVGAVHSTLHYLKKLTDTMEYSRLRRLANEAHRLASNEQMDPVEIRDWIASQLAATPARRVSADGVAPLMREIVDLSRTARPSVRVQTGLSRLDRAIGGMRPGQLAILAARPSVGKSALAAQVAINAARDKHSVLFVSLEMTATECVSRALASETGFSMQIIMDGGLNSDQIATADGVVEMFRDVPLQIADRRALTIDRLTALIRSESARRKLGLVVIDYLGLIQPADKRKSRWEYITEISHALKSLAQSESLPILALSQLNRESEGEVPKLSHLRDSGAIEQDADLVLLLHRATRQSTETELIVAKNRNGVCGVIELAYQPTRFTFDQVTAGEDWKA
jgi:replicative DNA helicase